VAVIDKRLLNKVFLPLFPGKLQKEKPAME
jgi:hypothetical protein